MTSDPYGDKPKSVSAPGDWHEIRFQISIDKATDWDKVEVKKWVHNIARYTALHMARSTVDAETLNEEQDPIKTVLLGLKIERIKFATDDELHNMIDKFQEDNDTE